MKNLIFLDTEATGNEPDKDRISQVCYKMGDAIRTEYFKPPVPISVKAMAVTHITNKMVEDKPAFIGSDMQQELQKLLAENILVAHNAPFDIAMLKNEEVETPHFIDTLRVARHLDTDAVIPEYNLQYLRYYLDLDVPGANAHDAEGDVLVLEALFNRLKKKVEETYPDTDPIKKMQEISSTPTLMRKFTFGKHKGKLVEEVVKTDRGYLEWLHNQKIQDGVEGQDDDWLYTLEHYLKID